MSRPAAQLVSPSGPLRREAFDPGLEAAAELELPLTWDEALLTTDGGYLAGTDEERARRLVEAIEARPAALWMARGGYGAIRTLEAAPELFGLDPVPLWGFSDGTALLAAWDRAGWPAWHAPPITQLARLDADSRERTRDAWHRGEVRGFGGLTPISAGRATAPLAGGNLCVLASLVGTPFQADLRGRIVLLEDTGEVPYKVDRLFTQLRLAGAFDGIAGLVVGDFSGVDDELLPAIEAFFDDAAARLGVPAARGLPIGHGTRNAPLPFGTATGWRATLDVTATGGATLSFARR